MFDFFSVLFTKIASVTKNDTSLLKVVNGEALDKYFILYGARFFHKIFQGQEDMVREGLVKAA